MTTVYVLLLVISGLNKMGTINQEFTTKERCEAALESMAKQVAKENVVIHATCSPK